MGTLIMDQRVKKTLNTTDEGADGGGLAGNETKCSELQYRTASKLNGGWYYIDEILNT